MLNPPQGPSRYGRSSRPRSGRCTILSSVNNLWVVQSWLDSVGINRRGVVNERVIQERSSDHPDPEPCEGSRKAALEAVDRGICGLGIELRKRQSREPTASARPEGNRAVRDSASAPWPAESKTPCTHRNGAPSGPRENRETPWLPAVERRGGGRRKRGA